MTRFADELFNDLMREHGSTLAHTTVAAGPKRHPAARPVVLTVGAVGVAVAATVGTLAVSGGTPAYAVTAHPDGTVTLAVYQQSGIAQANARLHALGDRVVVVPVRSGCPSIDSLPAPKVPASQISVQASTSGDGSATVAAQGVPVGDILVLGLLTTGNGQFRMQMTAGSGSAQGAQSDSGGQVQQASGGKAHGPASAPPVGAASALTSGPAPSCVSIPAGSLPPAGKASGSVSCAYSSASVGGLPAGSQKSGPDTKAGSPDTKAGLKVSSGCSGQAVKGSHVTPTGSSSDTHSND